MSLRFRKSIKIAPGVKLNLGKRGVGMSVGTKGARVSVNSKGRVTKTVGIPGTGISYSSTDSINSSKKKSKTPKAKSNDSSSQDFTPPISGDVIDSYNSNNQSPKRNKRWFIYAIIAIIAVIINSKLFYPTILIESIIHLIHIKKDLNNHPKQKKYNMITICIIVFSILGTLLTTFAAPAVESISISAKYDTMDINQKQNIALTYLPENANNSNIDIKVSDESLAKISIIEDGKIELETLSNEGSFSIQAESGNIKSNEVSISIIDTAKQEAERIAAEKKIEEERIAAEKKAEDERIASEKKLEEKRSSTANSQTDNSPTVYVTPTGKRYHYDSSCNGGSYSASTLSKATSMGLAPCKKCVN